MTTQDTLDGDTVVRVRRHWNDYRVGSVSLKSIEGLRFDAVSGGVGVSSPRPMLYGYIWCDSLIEGKIAHSCSHGPGPHCVKVVIVKKDNDPKVVKALEQIAKSRSQPR